MYFIMGGGGDKGVGFMTAINQFDLFFLFLFNKLLILC